MGDGSHDDAQFQIVCRHADYLGVRLDFSEIARGAPEVVKSKGPRAWLGGFRGRPLLARELTSALDLLHGAAKPKQFARYVASFRGLWRMLDQLERDGLAPVERLADLSTFHGIQWLRWKQQPDNSSYALVRSTLEVARELAALEPLAWIASKKPKPKLGDVATPEQAHRVYLALKHRVYAAYDRWRDADLLAQQGRNLLDVPREKRLPPSKVTEADLHASYRALIARTGNPTPTDTDLVKAMGYSPYVPDGSRRRFRDVFFGCRAGFRDISEGLYPGLATAQHFFHLFLIQTGWNPQVALDLDISSPNWAVKIGDPTADIYRLSSFKVRSGTWQRTVSRGKPSHSPYQLILRLAERTRPMREAISQERVRCPTPTIALRSPWLHITDLTAADVVVMNDKSYIRDHRAGIPYLVALAKEINANETRQSASGIIDRDGPEKARSIVPENMKASDFRDIYIGSQFLQSGYNLVIAKLAAGHVNMSTIRRYLATRAWRRHSEGSVRRLMDHLWGEVETHRVCDPAILKALCDRGVITDEQRERWAIGKDKTYLGMGCVNPRQPPKHIDPTHVSGRICRNQHRCTLCEHGIVMPESMPDLCKRLAELNALQIRMSLAAWDRADDLREERQKLVRTLAQFNPIEVAEEVDRWEIELQQGRHHILEWDGVHEH